MGVGSYFGRDKRGCQFKFMIDKSVIRCYDFVSLGVTIRRLHEGTLSPVPIRGSEPG